MKKFFVILRLGLRVCPGVSLWLGTGLAARGADCNPVAITALDQGWYDSNGTHSPGNDNYFCGDGVANAPLRNWFVFNIPTFTQPVTSAALRINAWRPDGFFISNGPGDPSVMDYAITTVKKMLNSEKPVFGICLGHQLLALASGISTYKMHHGHRGLNHPVKNLITGLGEMTSQNHGFAISEKDIEKNPDVEITHLHLNDNTIMGIRLKSKKAFSVQYHPEASPGPHDSRYLFDQFLSMIKEEITVNN